MQSWEPLGSSGTARERECGRWATLADVVMSEGSTPTSIDALPSLLPFPRNWPAAFQSSPTLKRLVNKKLKGKRCRAVGAPTPEQQTALSRTVLHPLHSCRNAMRLAERLGWTVVKGFVIFEYAGTAPGTGYLALRHWWNTSESGAWIDATPPPLALPRVSREGDVESRVLLVESELGEWPEAALTPTRLAEAVAFSEAMARAFAAGLVGDDAARGGLLAQTALEADEVPTGMALYEAALRRLLSESPPPPSLGGHPDDAHAVPTMAAGLQILLGNQAASELAGTLATPPPPLPSVVAAAPPLPALTPAAAQPPAPAPAVAATATAHAAVTAEARAELSLSLRLGLARCHWKLGDGWEAALVATDALESHQGALGFSQQGELGEAIGEAAGRCVELCAALETLLGDAAAHLGLLAMAEEALRLAAARVTSGGSPHERVTSGGSPHERVRRRLAAIGERSEAGRRALDAEIHRLTASLGEEEARKSQRMVAEMMVLPAGRQRLVETGHLTPADLATEHDWDLGLASRRAVHTALTYAVKKRLQQRTTMRQASVADGTSGGNYKCVPPAVVANPAGGGAPLLSAAQLRDLDLERIVVADGVVPDDVLAAASREFAFLVGSGLLRSDVDDLCNPLQRSLDVPIHDASIARHLARDCPTLARLVATLFNLPSLLEAELGLSLRVPQHIMLAAYPPGARYRRHMDSYGGRDIPRYLTCLLYVGWEPRQGGQLRAYTPDGVRDIEPQPGRLCVFYAQEIEHEVLPSLGERYAITLWIWSTERDDQGR